MLSLQSGASADQLSNAQAKAAQIAQEIQTTGQQIDALDQKYEGAQAHKASLDQQITVTEGKIAKTKVSVAKDRATLRKVAVHAYLSDGSSASQNPLFAGNETQAEAAKVFNRVAEGDLGTAVAVLHTAQTQLNAQESTLRTQDQQAAQAVTVANDAFQRAQALEAQQQGALDQVKGQIATLVAQQQQAEARAQERAAQARLAFLAQSRPPTATLAVDGSPPPPPSPGGGGMAAVRAAESQIGVPYVWGAESPGSGFDCSGLVAWSWGQAGVGLPHYSGAQMSDSTPVPVSDLQPGDLLFYGPGGSDHVAMYVGGGAMIEAPYTGASVRITGVRLGTGFAGAGRP